MPRVMKVSRSEATSVTISRRTINLRSIPREDQVLVQPGVMRQKLFAWKPPRQDLYRSRYGRSLNLDTIETALLAADWGSMRALTDLSRETIDTDPHLASVLNKRFGSISSLPWEIIPAEGIGIDREKAKFYADIVRIQLKQLPAFGSKIHQLSWALFDGRAALEIEWALAPTIPGLPAINHPQFGTVNWMVKDLGWIHPRRLHFGPEREVRLYDELLAATFAPQGVALRDVPFKFIYWTPQIFGDYPEREGLARRCLYWSFFKRFSARERMILLELFGKPFRWLEVDEESTADAKDLESADEMLQNIGGLSSFRFPRGTKFQLAQPQKGAGEVHQETIVESDKQISKLVLGQTGTTDANPAGLNNAQANVMQDEQFGILVRDASLESDIFESQLTDAIIEVNFGASEVNHAPRFRLRADVPLDRVKELSRLQAAINTGLEIPLAEAYEVSGFRAPAPDEAILKIDTPPVHPMAIQPDPSRAVVEYPEGTKFPVRRQPPVSTADGARMPTPSPAATPPPVVPAAPEPAKPPPAPPQPEEPPVAASMTASSITLPFAGFKDFDECISKMISQGHDKESASKICGALQRDYEGAAPTLSRAHASDRIVIAQTLIAKLTLTGECGCCSVKLEGDQAVDQGGDFRTAKQPEEDVVGSIETLINKGVREGARETAKIADAYSTAGTDYNDPGSIGGALQRVHDDLDLHSLSRVIERRIIHSVMTGIIAAHYETQTNTALPVPKLERSGQSVLLDVPVVDPRFVDRPFGEALKWFKERSLVPRSVFDRLETAAKRRAFTIAGATNDMMLEKARDELAAIVHDGRDLRDFQKYVAERMETAGFVPANASHVEAIYRTNVVNAMNAGRHAQATQPAVIRLRPYWQIRTANDGPPRQRKTHQAVHGWVIAASDPIWQSIYPPFGVNCRCRVVTMSERDVKERGIKPRTGIEVTGLPDPGFTSGVSSLL